MVLAFCLSSEKGILTICLKFNQNILFVCLLKLSFQVAVQNTIVR